MAGKSGEQQADGDAEMRSRDHDRRTVRGGVTVAGLDRPPDLPDQNDHVEHQKIEKRQGNDRRRLLQKRRMDEVFEIDDEGAQKHQIDPKGQRKREIPPPVFA